MSRLAASFCYTPRQLVHSVAAVHAVFSASYEGECPHRFVYTLECQMKTQWGLALVTVTGAFLTILGALIIALWPDIYQRFLFEELHLSESSTSYRLWRGTPVPLYIQFYFFNWTNPEDIENMKPVLREMGPYRFK
ncbi:hypothetical protein B566_EDAN014639 [Ephemera danica]|nr:hypothetical protein B566_EDAN014639 [Ephemera danica]